MNEWLKARGWQQEKIVYLKDLPNSKGQDVCVAVYDDGCVFVHANSFNNKVKPGKYGNYTDFMIFMAYSNWCQNNYPVFAADISSIHSPEDVGSLRQNLRKIFSPNEVDDIIEMVVLGDDYIII